MHEVGFSKINNVLPSWGNEKDYINSLTNQPIDYEYKLRRILASSSGLHHRRNHYRLRSQLRPGSYPGSDGHRIVTEYPHQYGRPRRHDAPYRQHHGIG